MVSVPGSFKGMRTAPPAPTSQLNLLQSVVIAHPGPGMGPGIPYNPQSSRHPVARSLHQVTVVQYTPL
jgi:hypothetical protein